MGNKVSPISVRLEKSKNWKFDFITDKKNYNKFFFSSIEIKNYIEKVLYNNKLSFINIYIKNIGSNLLYIYVYYKSPIFKFLKKLKLNLKIKKIKIRVKKNTKKFKKLSKNFIFKKKFILLLDKRKNYFIISKRHLPNHPHVYQPRSNKSIKRYNFKRSIKPVIVRILKSNEKVYNLNSGTAKINSKLKVCSFRFDGGGYNVFQGYPKTIKIIKFNKKKNKFNFNIKLKKKKISIIKKKVINYYKYNKNPTIVKIGNKFHYIFSVNSIHKISKYIFKYNKKIKNLKYIKRTRYLKFKNYNKIKNKIKKRSIMLKKKKNFIEHKKIIRIIILRKLKIFIFLKYLNLKFKNITKYLNFKFILVNLDFIRYLKKYSKKQIFLKKEYSKISKNLNLLYIAINLRQPDLISKVVQNFLFKRKYHKKYFYYIVNDLKKLCNLKINKFFVGFRIQLKGKLNGKLRSKKLYTKYGKNSLNCLSFPVYYSYLPMKTKYGIFGIKVWLIFKNVKKKKKRIQI